MKMHNGAMDETTIFICQSSTLEEGGKGIRFPLTAGGEDATGFVVRYDNTVYGYLNRCAHVPIELDWNEGDFFESAEAFFRGDLPWTLAALHRHFFSGGDARPILSALQNRNRILLQVRALLDAGEARLGPRGLDGLPKAAALHGAKFTGATEKSSFNLFSQNAWYVGKLAGGAKLPALRRLIDNQQEFIAAFEEIIRRPQEQEDVLREMAVRCLTAA